MTQPKRLDPYTSPRAFYGSELRRLREEAKMSQEQLGALVFCSGTYIGQLESAVRRPQHDISKQLDEIFGSGEHLQRLCGLARQSKHADYFADAAELETLARTISEYAPTLVPGLLQTELYARAVTRAALPLAPEEEVEGHVRNRMDRQSILNAPTPPLLWVVLHETVLRVSTGGQNVMAGQLLHIAEMVSAHRILVQVLPFATAAQVHMQGMASIMTFPDAAAVVYVEGSHTGQLVEDAALVERHQRSYDLVRAAALSPMASLTLIESAAKDFISP
jgi:transcriptional regulator with XRE-family HTH domain